MCEGHIIQGRRIGPSELEQVRQLLAAHPTWSRRRVSQELARLWSWRNGVGQLKDMAARTLLSKLAQRGWIVLPPRRQAPSNRMRQKQMPLLELPMPSGPLRASLESLRPLAISEVSTLVGSRQRALFEALLHQHHYLSHRSFVGDYAQMPVMRSWTSN